MQTLISKLRYILCFVIISAFFLPSYQDISGFTFIPLAFSSTDDQSEISTADVFIATIPLILIPVSSIAILVRTYMRRQLRQTFKALPLICLAVFTILLFLSLRTIAGGGMSSLRILSHLREGFYITAIASMLLPFTKSPYRRKVKRVQEQKAEAA
ncbi:MAG: hypothetical protein EOO10_04240 [Chitinophagaceae bacterium]|nr:MAG: hypothetical protein EOO10_04240 [Chitinophagaceae bacterium]